MHLGCDAEYGSRSFRPTMIGVRLEKPLWGGWFLVSLLLACAH